MVKRKPLRSSTSSVKMQRRDEGKIVCGREKKNGGEVAVAGKLKARAKNRSKMSGDEEGDEWAEIERRQQREDTKNSNSKDERGGVGDEDDDDDDDKDDDSDEDESEDDIKLHGEGGKKTDDFTFEFNDMRETYSEGICTLLNRKMISNPSSAYALATAITSQGVL